MAAEPTRSFPDGVVLSWRGRLSDEELVDLVVSHGGTPVRGWWDRIRPHSLGWVTARLGDSTVIGFVNVATDGGDHAFLIDTKTHGACQRRGVGTRVVGFAAEIAARGIQPAQRETYSNGVRKTTYRGPDGNEVGLGGAPLPPRQ